VAREAREAREVREAREAGCLCVPTNASSSDTHALEGAFSPRNRAPPIVESTG
jgi:hypothetical protein